MLHPATNAGCDGKSGFRNHRKRKSSLEDVIQIQGQNLSKRMRSLHQPRFPHFSRLTLLDSPSGGCSEQIVRIAIFDEDIQNISGSDTFRHIAKIDRPVDFRCIRLTASGRTDVPILVRLPDLVDDYREPGSDLPPPHLPTAPPHPRQTGRTSRPHSIPRPRRR